MNHLFLLTSICSFYFIFIKNKKALQMLQQNWYDDDHRYLKWIMNNITKVFFSLDILFFIFPLLTLFIKDAIVMIIFLLFYIILGIVFKNNYKKEQQKKPLVITARVKRLMTTITIIYLIPMIIFYFCYNASMLGIYYFALGGLIYLNYFIVFLAVIINTPVEKQVFYHYRRMAKKKLKQMKLDVIGITGSYGKTSSKNILSDILNVSYDAFPTPKNFNTTYGLIRTINNYLDKFADFFIAEMGAFKKGEIKELCDLVHPKYGILTIIGTAHLDSFKTRENIQKTKFELIESLPIDGIGILNLDDPYQVSYQLKNKCQIVWIGIDNKDADVYASNIKLSNNGTTFDCHFKGDNKTYTFTTVLLGKANVYNILAGVALGYKLGMSIDKLILGVKSVKPVEHRLELKQLGDLYIIDDAYNSNPVGSSMALDVLDLMDGKKIVVTPGMIELQDLQYTANKEFGIHMAKVADEVILIGSEQTKPIYDGLIEMNYDKKKIHILNDVKMSFPLMNELKDGKTYCLLENDLPDIFNEKN